MGFNKLLGIVFSIIFIIILYVIIIYALKIMSKDVKNGGKKKILKKSLGLEVIDAGENTSMKKGSIIPIRGVITLGRKEDNTFILSDQYVSGYHVKLYVKNENYILQDLNSTNGTIVNGERIKDKVYIQPGDEIQIGSLYFKVIG